MERTNFEASVHKNDLSKIIKLLGRSLGDHTNLIKNIQKEKEVIKEEILEEQGEADHQYKRFLKENFYGKNSLSLNIAGNDKALEDVTKKEVNNFLAEFYQPANMVLTLAGKIDEKKILSEVDKYFRFLSPAKIEHSEFKEFSYPGDNIYFTKGRENQVWFNWYFPWPKNNNLETNIKRDFLVKLLRQYLIIYFRDLGFCYVFGIDFLTFSDYSDVGIEASFNFKKAVDFYKLLGKRIASFKNDLSEEELKTAKDNQIKLLELDSDYPRMEANNLSWNHLTFGSAMSFVEQKEVINSVILKDVQGLFDELIGSKRGTIFVGGRLSQKVQIEIKNIWNR